MIASPRIYFTLCAAVLLLSACGPRKSSILINFEPGAARVADLKSETEIAVTALGLTINVTLRIDAGLKFVVKSVDQTGAADLAVTFERFNVDVVAPFDEIADDGETRKTLDEIEDAYRGKTISARVTPLGQIERVTGADRIEAELRALRIDRRGAGPLGDLMQLASEDTVRDMVGVIFESYRLDPAAVGDTWTAVQPLVPGMPFDVNVQYTLNDWMDDGAAMDVTGEMSKNEVRLPGPLAITIQPDLAGTHSGNRTLHADGWVRSEEIKTDLSGVVALNEFPFPLPENAKSGIKLAIRGTRRVASYPQ